MMLQAVRMNLVKKMKIIKIKRRVMIMRRKKENYQQILKVVKVNQNQLRARVSHLA